MPEHEAQVRPFADWMTEQRNGLLHAELTDAFNELIESVNQHGKAGELVMKIKIKPAAKAQGAVAVADDVSVKKPVGDRGEALFFVDKNNNLTRENPQQPRLPLREVTPPASAESTAKEA